MDRRKTLLGAVLGGCLAMLPGTALAAQNVGVCDGLKQGASPGLYGLCLALCEAQDCVPDYTQPNPFASCTPSSSRILDLYNERKGPNDPGMPCVEQTSGCPCFSAEDLEGIPTPYRQCLIDYDFGNSSELYTNILSTATENGTGAQAQTGQFTNSCAFGDATVEPDIFIFLEVSPAAAQACRQLLVDHINANQDQCQAICDPVCH